MLPCHVTTLMEQDKKPLLAALLQVAQALVQGHAPLERPLKWPRQQKREALKWLQPLQPLALQELQQQPLAQRPLQLPQALAQGQRRLQALAQP